MFLLSAGAAVDFDEGDRMAVRAVAEAGVAALEAEIKSSPVQHVVGLLGASLAPSAPPTPADLEASKTEVIPSSRTPSAATIAETAEALRVRTGSDLTLALIDGSDRLIAANGLAEPHLAMFVEGEAFAIALQQPETDVSVVLGDELHVARLTEPNADGQRLLAVAPLNTGAGSLLRRVLGAQTPAGLVREGRLVGTIIGDQPLIEVIEVAAKTHENEAPPQGASQTFRVGRGLDARLVSIGRVPGPAGRGPSGVTLVVVSRHTLAAGHRDLVKALSEAGRKAWANVNWLMLAGLLMVSIGLALYLPELEALGPLRRLRLELDGVAEGTRNRIFHESYSGPTATVARSAARAVESLRHGTGLHTPTRDPGLDPPLLPPPSGLSGPFKANDAPLQPLAPGSLSSAAHVAIDLTPLPDPLQIAPTLPVIADADVSEDEPSGTRSENPPTAVSTRRRPTVIERRTFNPSLPQPPPPPPPKAKPTGEDPYYRGLYEEFLQVKTACGESIDNLTFERFMVKLRRNEDDLRAKRTDIKDVRFSVYVKDGRAALKAKVVRS